MTNSSCKESSDEARPSASEAHTSEASLRVEGSAEGGLHDAGSPADADAQRSKSEGSLWTRNFVCGTLVNFAISTNYFMLMVVMTAYALNVFAAPPAIAALCASAFIIGTLVSRFIAAPLMGAVGRKPLLVVAVALEVGLTALYLANEPVGALIGVRFLHGMAYGVCSTTIATVVTAGIPAAHKGEGVGYFMLSSTLGSAIGPFVGILIANNLGYPVLFVVSCVVVALGIPFVFALDSTDQKPGNARASRKLGKHPVDDAESAEDALAAAEDAMSAAEIGPSKEAARDVAVSNREEALASGEAGAALNSRTRKSWLLKSVEPSVLPIAAVAGLIFFGYSSLLTFLTPYAAEIGLSRAASVFFVAYALAMFITRPFTGRAFDRRGPGPVMSPAFFSFAIGMVLVATSSNDWMLLGAALLLGFGVGTVQSCGLAVAVNIASDDRLSAANATFYILVDAGVGVGPLLLGVIVPLIGYEWLYFCMAGVGLLGFVAFVIVLRRMKKAGKL